MKITFLIVVLIALCSCSTPTISVSKTGESLQMTKQVKESVIDKKLMLKMVNDVRAKGCRCGNKIMSPAPALKWNNNLEKAAKLQSTSMYNGNYFSHVSPDGKSTLRNRLYQVNYAFSWSAENIAHGKMDTRQVMEGWLNSPGHCENLMNPLYKEMGAALVEDYWTQVFGAQKSTNKK